MGSPVVLSKAAVLARLDASLVEDVHTAEPIHYSLPYVNFVRAGIAERRHINKTSELWTIETTWDIVGYAHDDDAKTTDALTTEVDEALEDVFTLADYTVSDQRVSQMEAYRGADEQGAELEITRLTFQLDIL